jgi:hypothetical protein
VAAALGFSIPMRDSDDAGAILAELLTNPLLSRSTGPRAGEDRCIREGIEGIGNLRCHRRRGSAAEARWQGFDSSGQEVRRSEEGCTGWEWGVARVQIGELAMRSCEVVGCLQIYCNTPSSLIKIAYSTSHIRRTEIITVVVLGSTR